MRLTAYPHRPRRSSESPRKISADIRPRRWSAVATQAGLGDADALIHEILALVPTALSTVGALLPKKSPAHVSNKIFAGIAQQAKVLAAS